MSIFFLLLTAFLMLQVHNMMPHKHPEKLAKKHAHQHDDHGHHHESKSENPDQPAEADHSAEFGKALIKPGSSKYQMALIREIPLFKNELSAVHVRIDDYIFTKLQPPSRMFLIAPPPYLVGVNFRGPPSFI